MPNELLPWRILERKIAYEDPFLQVWHLKSQRQDHTDPTPLFQVTYPDWVVVIPVTPSGAVLFVRQFRHGIQSETLEVPGGVMDAAESPLDAAQRELQEETGFVSGEWISLGVVHPNPAIQTNRCHLFLALGARKGAETAFDDDEELAPCFLSSTALREALTSGEITNSIVLSGLAIAMARGAI